MCSGISSSLATAHSGWPWKILHQGFLKNGSSHSKSTSGGQIEGFMWAAGRNAVEQEKQETLGGAKQDMFLVAESLCNKILLVDDPVCSTSQKIAEVRRPKYTR